MGCLKQALIVATLVGAFAQDIVFERLTTSTDTSGIYADPCRQDAGDPANAAPVRPCSGSSAVEDLTTGSTLLLPSDFATTGDIGDGLITIHGQNFPVPNSPSQTDLGKIQLALLQNREGAVTDNLAACRNNALLETASGATATSSAHRLIALTGSSKTKLIFKIQTSSGANSGAEQGWLDGNRAAPLNSNWDRLPSGLCVTFTETTQTANTVAAPTATYYYTGLKVKIVVNCEVSTATVAQSCADGAAYSARENFLNLNSAVVRHLKGKATCCKSSAGFGVGQCINDKQSTCCGSAAANTVATSSTRRAERCCNAVLGWVAGNAWDSGCPCRNGNLQKDADCPAGEKCCLETKFTTGQTVGSCYNANFKKCCDVGTVYDAGEMQCCPVDGLISVDQQCSCDDDADCNGDGKCCKQTDPALDRPVCNKYATWGSAYQAAKTAGTQVAYLDNICSGSCIDPKYQLCCNGASAFREYQRCCNNKAYNLFTETCTDGRSQPTKASNYNDFRRLTLMVSDDEVLNLLRSFWIFVLPTLLLLGTVGALALVLVFANKASSRSYSFVESSMIFLACTCALFALPLFFSPSYKYGIVFVVMALFTVLSAAARIKYLNAVCVLVQLLVLFYVFDPFHGNQLLNFSAYRLSSGAQNRDSAGLFHTVDFQWRNTDFCTEFYDYFKFDNSLRDTVRFDNAKVTTFGYCSRDYTFALLVFSAIAVLALLLLFIMTIVALLLRFRKPEDPVVELEVVPAY